MTYIIDVILILIVIIAVVVAAKKGFAAALVDAFSLLISAFAAYKASPIVSGFLYDNVVKDILEKKFSTALGDISSSMSVSDKVAVLTQSLPSGIINFASSLGLDINSQIDSLASSAANNEQLVETMVEKIARGAVTALLDVIVFIIIFTLASIVLSMLSKLFKKINDIPVVGNVNAALGGILGIINAVIIITVVCGLLYIAVEVSSDGTLAQTVNSSKIYTFVTEYNPIVEMFRGA